MTNLMHFTNFIGMLEMLPYKKDIGDYIPIDTLLK